MWSNDEVAKNVWQNDETVNNPEHLSPSLGEFKTSIYVLQDYHKHLMMMNLLVPHLPVGGTHSALFPRHHSHVIDCTRNLITTQLTSVFALVKTDCISLSSVSSFGSLHHTVLYAKLYTGDNSHCTNLSNQEVSSHIYGKQISAEKIQLNDNCKPISLIDKIDCEKDKEMQRRRKIGLANKGKVPWNKGKKHSAETCEKIKQNTKEAMSDPKVRKKISECPRSHSEQTKERIQSSLRKLWGQRLKGKRSRDKFVQAWTESIATAAKMGGSGQQKLQWNSYDIMEREIALQQLLGDEEKEKAKEISRKKRSQKKAEKTELLVLKRKERNEKRKTRNTKKSKKPKDHAVHEVKLKAMITKVHKRKTTMSQCNVQRQLVWENFDIELVKREMLQKEVSLADQIRVAKNMKERYITPKIFTSPLLPKVVVHE